MGTGGLSATRFAPVVGFAEESAVAPLTQRPPPSADLYGDFWTSAHDAIDD